MSDEEPKLSESGRKFVEKVLEFYHEHQLERINRSFFLLEPKAKQRRLRAIMDLSAERQRLLDEHGRNPHRPDLPQGFQASAFMEAVIQYLIEGDLDEVKAYTDMYLFEREDEWAEEWIQVYAKFRAMAHAAATEPNKVQ